jgi:hypothetical protein
MGKENIWNRIKNIFTVPDEGASWLARYHRRRLYRPRGAITREQRRQLRRIARRAAQIRRNRK